MREDECRLVVARLDPQERSAVLLEALALERLRDLMRSGNLEVVGYRSTGL